MPASSLSPSPVTIADWLDAYSEGADAAVLLSRAHAALDQSPAAAWIARASRDQLDEQLRTLAQREALHPDRASALRAMPLFGVPFAVKDNIDIAGMPTTAACPSLNVATPTHAAAVARLVAAGAVWFGKTNLDQFATGLVGTRSPYGRPSSTFSVERISGGSSSGSAVVVSRGEVAFSLGTDTAGSGRIPAGFNNIVGLKPTPGRVATRGVLPACRSIDCVSVFALTVADAARVLSVIEGPDPDDAYSAFGTGPADLPSPARIGVPASPQFTGDAGYADAFDAALAHASRLGHEIVELDFGPLHEVARLLYGGPWVAERCAAVEQSVGRERDALDPVVRQVIESGEHYSAADAFRAQYRLREMQHACAAIWRDVDALLVPTAPGHPRHADVDVDPLGANAALGTYTNFVNLLGWCAAAVPAGFTAQGLPFGVTFIAPGASDAALARVADAWQASLSLPLGATSRRFTRSSRVSWPASDPALAIAVVGAHLSGLPLNAQLVERGARLRQATRTAPHYRLYALPSTQPRKPGLQRVASGGKSIEVEVWDLPLHAVGSFLALIPPPLGLGSLQLADGQWVHGFTCEAHALDGAQDITSFGGWRAYLASLH